MYDALMGDDIRTELANDVCIILLAIALPRSKNVEQQLSFNREKDPQNNILHRTSSMFHSTTMVVFFPYLHGYQL
jgi:hypothetical protein